MAEQVRWDLVYKWADPETRSLVEAVTSALENCDRKLVAALATPPAAGLDEAWRQVEAALPPGGRLSLIFEAWTADMTRLGHAGLLFSRDEAVAALRDLAARLEAEPVSPTSDIGTSE